MSLDRTPATDLIPGTVAAWLEVMLHGRDWDRNRDTPRIRQAFVTLASTRTHWPAPRDFLEALPKFEPLRALPATACDPERAQKIIAEAQQLLGNRIPVKPAEVRAERADLAAVEAELRAHYGKGKQA